MQPPLSRLTRWPTAPLPSTQVAALAKRNCTAGSEAPASASATNVQSAAAAAPSIARLRCRAELFPGHGGGGAGTGFALAGSGWVSVGGGAASVPGSTWPTATGAASARSKRVGGSRCSGSAAVTAGVACVLGAIVGVGIESSSVAAFGLGLTDSSKAAQAASSISTTQLDRSTMGGQVRSPSSSSSRRASRHLTLCPACASASGSKLRMLANTVARAHVAGNFGRCHDGAQVSRASGIGLGLVLVFNR